MEKVLVLGSINIDFVSFVSRYPQPGETLVSNDFGIFQGGKGANQAIALAKLDVPTLMLGKVGKDIISNFALSSLQESGVDITGISKSQKNSTGSASIWVNTQGQNSIVIYPGANGEVDEDFIIQHEKFFGGASWLLTQFEVPLKSILLALKFAKKHDLKTIMDPAPVKKMSNNDIWGLVDYLLPNEIELRELTHAENVLKGIHILKSRGVKEVIVKLGKQGAGYEDRGTLNLFPAVPVGQVVDTTGAGDCFIAGFLYGMLQQEDIAQAIQVANLTASYSIQKKGAAISFPNKSEIDWKKLE
ncbi:MAG TPA: ribokinase [Candidatus Atribacteria bacterium]|jgi:ribokinase|nr:ribokinase [Candidatus Atribacteria bacterium]